jgi:hypothetical protein
MFAFLHSPPGWMIFGFLLIGLISFVPIVRGIFVLIARKPGRSILVRTAVIQLAFIALGGACSLLSTSMLGSWEMALLATTFPFGLFAMILFMGVFSALDPWYISANVFVIGLLLLGSFFNFAGILAIVHFIFDQKKYR